MALYEYNCYESEELFDVVRTMPAVDEPGQCDECGGTV